MKWYHYAQTIIGLRFTPFIVVAVPWRTSKSEREKKSKRNDIRRWAVLATPSSTLTLFAAPLRQILNRSSKQNRSAEAPSSSSSCALSVTSKSKEIRADDDVGKWERWGLYERWREVGIELGERGQARWQYFSSIILYYMIHQYQCGITSTRMTTQSYS